jgi:fumarate hydratase class II
VLLVSRPTRKRSRRSWTSLSCCKSSLYVVVGVWANLSATCLNSVLGYDDVAAIAKNAHKKGIT